MKKQTLIFLSFLFSLSLFGQNLQQRFDFLASYQSMASSILKTSDGGFLMIGSIGNDIDPTKGDIALIKTDARYELEWQQKYFTFYSSGSNGILCNAQAHLEYAADAIELSDGYVVVGSHDRKDGLLCSGPNTHLLGDFDVMVTKVDKQGTILWSKTYGNPNVQMATGIIATNDGGFLVSGFANIGGVLTAARPWFLKLDKDGIVEWSQLQASFAFQGVAALVGAGAWKFPVIELKNGGYLYLASAGNDSYLVKLNANGNMIWSKKFFHGAFTGHLNSNPDWGIGAASYAFFHSMIEKPNGNLTILGNLYFALAVVINPNDPLGAFFAIGGIAELDSTGTFVKGSVFTHPTGHGGTIFDMITTDMELLSNGNYLIGGLKEGRSFLLEYDFDATQANSHGVWARQFGPYTYSSAPFGLDLPSFALKNGRAALFYDNFKLAVTDLNAAADSCGFNWAPIQSLEVQPFNLADVSSNMNFNTSLGQRDSLRLRQVTMDNFEVVYECNSTTLAVEDDLVENEGVLYPNPVSGNQVFLKTTELRAGKYAVEVLDLYGRVVWQENFQLMSGEQYIEISLPAELVAGQYVLRFSWSAQSVVKRFIKR